MSPSLSRACAAALIAFALSSESTLAQTTESRPRIGLALSGGGARGIAHVGVLKVMDELRVPIDCVTGTSMGSIVGGAFAAGVSPRSMERVIAGIDWNDLFTDRPPRGEISPRRKRDDYKGFFGGEFGVRNGSLLLPRGLVSGVALESFLRTLTAQAASVTNFDQLPVPFRTVATDIETGQSVILDRGNLALAMRASMAIPGAMEPVSLDGRLLVDGGIANNLPIDLARDLCKADVIVAVNIGSEPLKRDDLTSALAIVGQLVNFLGKDSVDRQIAGLGAQDVLIAPDLGDIGSSSFDRSSDAIRIGEAAARRMSEQLARYALPPDRYAALRARQTLPRVAGLGRVDAIRFEGLKRSNPDVLARLIDAKPGTPITEGDLTRDLRRIYGRGDFDSVDYRIEEGPGSRVLVIQAREKEIGPDYVRFGLTLASDFRSGSYFNALGSYRRTWLNQAGAEWVTEAQVGRNAYLFSEFVQPFWRGAPGFIAPYAVVSRSYRPIYVNDSRIAEYERTERAAGVDLGANLGQWGEVRIGPMWRVVNATIDTGITLAPPLRVNASGLRLNIFGDRLDSAFFPREGHRFIVSAFGARTALGADISYTRLEASGTKAFSAANHTLVFNAYGGTAFGTRLPIYDPFMLGGPFRLSGYAINQFAGERALFGAARYFLRVRQLPSPLGSGVYIGGSAEVGRIERRYDTGPDVTRWSSSLFVGAETFLGPAWLGFGVAPGGNRSFFLTVGVP